METDELTLLVEQAKAHDNNAIMQLYEEYHNNVYFLCLKIVKNEDDALDLVQDSFLQAFSKLDTLQNPAQFRSWLNQIAANKCRDFLKKKKPLLFSEKSNEEEDSEDFEIEDRDESLIPDKVIDNAETRRLVIQIIDDLPDLQRMTVMLYYYEEKSVAQIAETMECSENTVKSRLNYARKQIKKQVLELEEKGTKLYAAVPMLFPLLHNAAADCTMSASASSAVLGNITSSMAVTGASGSTAGVAASASSKIAGASLPVKIAAGAAAVLMGGAAILFPLLKKPTPSAKPAGASVSVSSASAFQSQNTKDIKLLKEYLASIPKTQSLQHTNYWGAFYKSKQITSYGTDLISIQIKLMGSKLVNIAPNRKGLLLKYRHSSDKGADVIIYTGAVVENGKVEEESLWFGEDSNKWPEEEFDSETNTNDVTDRESLYDNLMDPQGMKKSSSIKLNDAHDEAKGECSCRAATFIVQNKTSQEILVSTKIEWDDEKQLINRDMYLNGFTEKKPLFSNWDIDEDEHHTFSYSVNDEDESSKEKYDKAQKYFETTYEDITNQIQWDPVS